MIKSFKEKVKEILESKTVRLEDGSYGYLYKGTVSAFLGYLEEWARHNRVHEEIKTETEKVVLAEIKELDLKNEAEIHPSAIKKLLSKIKSWQEKLKSDRR